ncbi:MAG: CpaF family protein [Eubacteriales bacterium]|nr:CpaF family protein [Eubacteriales bacterium]
MAIDTEQRFYAEIRELILRDISENNNLQDRELLDSIDSVLDRKSSEYNIGLREKLELKNRLFNSFRKLDVLQELLDNKSVTEIMINSPEEIFIEINNHMERWNVSFENEERLEDIIQQIVSRINRRVNTSTPIADARLPDGSRVHIVLPPIALKGPTITIRKFPEPIDMKKMIRSGTITYEAAGVLKTLVAAGYNIFISGGTSSGKSTFLNALTQYIPEDERVITIEDSAELQIKHVKNLVSLETRDANSEGEGEISMSKLIKASLRMRPDRVIVGEVRGAEALDMLSAMNTGHDGSLSTGHANSTKDMLTRIESMVLMAVELPLPAIKSQIAAGLDILVHLQRMQDHSRKVMEISEIKGVENGEITLNKLFEFNYETEKLERCGSLIHREKLEIAGLGIDGL